MPTIYVEILEGRSDEKKKKIFFCSLRLYPTEN